MILRITLRSDLCAAVGKGFAATIDTDTAVDEYGLPYIPARRLKGCLREIAELYMESETLNGIFGVTAQGEGGALRLADARLVDYDALIKECKDCGLSANDVTSLFCSVRGETAIDPVSGSAEDQSLRFTRVVERLSPFDQKPLVFEAEITCPGYDNASKDAPAEESVLGILVRRLRHIGYHRNRGLGTVKCELIKDNKTDKTGIIEKGEQSDADCYELTYTVKLVGDLMLPDSDANRSMDYIPGASVLGALAGAYVSKKGDNGFNSLFYSKDVCFGNLYPSDEAGQIAYPAPAFLGVVKGAAKDDKGVKNLIGKHWNTKQPEEEKKEEQKQYKPFKKDYIDPMVQKKKVETKVVYHNALNGDSPVGLYTQQCLCAGQYFTGTIRAPQAKLSIIAELLADGILRFGRSKTAQYSLCRIMHSNLHKAQNPNVAVAKNSFAAFVLRSDVVLVDEQGVYTTELAKLIAQINKLCGDVCPANVNSGLLKETTLRTRTVSGYNAKWNLKKPQFPALRAGSCVVFRVPEAQTLSRFICIGEKQNEGYGLIELLPEADKIKEQTGSDKATVAASDVNGPLSQAINKKKTKESVIKKAIEKAATIRLQPAQVGRVMLMCKESDSIDDFDARINSIKSGDTKKKAQNAFSKQKLTAELSELRIADQNKDFWMLCQLYILTALTVKKYALRMKGETD